MLFNTKTWFAKKRLETGSWIVGRSSFTPACHLKRKIRPYTGLHSSHGVGKNIILIRAFSYDIELKVPF